MSSTFIKWAFLYLYLQRCKQADVWEILLSEFKRTLWKKVNWCITESSAPDMKKIWSFAADVGRIQGFVSRSLTHDSWLCLNTGGRYFYTLFLRRADPPPPSLEVQSAFTVALVKRGANLPLKLSIAINADCVWEKKCGCTLCVCVCVPRCAQCMQCLQSFLPSLKLHAAQMLTTVVLICILSPDMLMKASSTVQYMWLFLPGLICFYGRCVRNRQIRE